MNLGRKYPFIIVFLLGLITSPLHAQKNTQQMDPELTWLTAMDLWNKEKYATAQKHFLQIQNFYGKGYHQRKADAHFYAANCALKLYNKDAEFRFRRFLELYPEDPRGDQVYFLLGEYNYERKRYQKSLDWLSYMDEDNIASEDRSKLHYIKGYSLFKTDKLDEAQQYFKYNLNEDDPYYFPALYYNAYINYVYEHYQLALDDFEKLSNEEGFSDLVPYYIAQIYFLQQRYDDVITYTEPWMDQVASKYQGDMARIMAESYYYEGDFSKALKYYKDYFRTASGVSRDDFYAYAYCLFKDGDYEEAIKQFNKCINEDDALTQVALLNMGDCFLRLEKFKNAQNAFKNAAAMDYDPTIKEEAFFNYAKLSYKLSFDPYDEAIQAFEAYLDSYPHSEKKDEAYIFLLNVYMKTKNYRSALDVIEKIKYPDYKVKSAYQMAVYNIAVEHYIQKDYDEALKWFQFVSKYEFEKLTLAESYFWQAELKFKKKNYRDAIQSYQSFLKADKAFESEYFSRAYYGQAYSQLKLKAYAKSMDSFNQFLQFDKGHLVRLNADAEQRIADLYFLQKDYDLAIKYFKSAIKHHDFDKDYALYQIAMAQGYTEKEYEKIETLDRLIDEMTTSVYRAQAYFEKGLTYFDLENYDPALAALNTLEDEYPSSSLIAESYLKKGLIYIKKGDSEASRDAFLYVFENFPNSKSANEALISLKEVDLATFTRIAKESGYADISEEDVDAANFEEAEETYLAGNYEKAARYLGHYLNGFPNGRFRQNAHFYKADCHVRADEPDSALISYSALLEQPGSPYYENALYMSAHINRDLENRMEAYGLYQKLYDNSENKQYRDEALEFLLFEGFQQADFIKVVEWAKIYRAEDRPSATRKQKALLLQMKSHVQLEEKPLAFELMNEVDFEMRDATTAELAFMRANWTFQKGDMDHSEEELYFLLQNFGAYGEWRARGFILLGDVYLAKEDPFQAKATWQSVIDHHKGADLVAVAQQKLDALIASEEEANKRIEDEAEIDFNIRSGEVVPGDSLLTEETEVLPNDSLINDEK